MKSTVENIPSYLKLLPFGTNLIDSLDSNGNFSKVIDQTEKETKTLGLMGVMGKFPGFLSDRSGPVSVNNEYGTEIRRIFKTGRRRSSRGLEIAQFSGNHQIGTSNDHEDDPGEDETDDQDEDEENHGGYEIQGIDVNEDINEEVLSNEDIVGGFDASAQIEISNTSEPEFLSSAGCNVNNMLLPFEPESTIYDTDSTRRIFKSNENEYPLPTKLILIDTDSERNEHEIPLLTNNGLSVSYTGNNRLPSQNLDYYIYKSDNQVLPNTGIFYYEVTIHESFKTSTDFNYQNKLHPKMNDGCGVSFGFASSDSLGKLSGSRADNRRSIFDLGSYTIDGSDGTITANCSVAKKFTRKFERGDIVGCGINYTKEEIFYVKNGVYLGVAFTDFKQILVPVIGVRYGSDITVNFGVRRYNQGQFTFDIEKYVKDQKQDVLSKLLQTGSREQKLIHGSLDEETEKKPTCDGVSLMTGCMMKDYFEYLGFVDVAQEYNEELKKELRSEKLDEHLFQEDTTSSDRCVGLAVDNNNTNDLLMTRALIREEIVTNQNIHNAISLINQKFPTLFGSNPELLFRLKCQILLSHIIKRENEESLNYGQHLRSEYLGFPEFQKELNEIFSLLAFQNPEDSEEHRALVSPQSFFKLNDFVNEAILKSCGNGSKPMLAMVLDHARELKDTAAEKRNDFTKSTYLVKLSEFGL